MKNYFESIDKTIRNFDTIEEAFIEKTLELHQDQWTSQEESWNTNLTRKAVTLWNLLIELVAKKYPYLVE
jgi:hypothetical protein